MTTSSFDDQYEQVRDLVRSFCKKKVRPGAAERDRSEDFPAEVLEEMGQLGLFGIFVPEELGGAGMDLATYLMIVEEVACADASIAVTISVTNSVCCWPILHFGSEEQKERYLRPLASGQVLGGFMLTEPEAGSDAASLKTRYRDAGDAYVLDGNKAWITNAGVAKTFVCMATKDPSLGAHGISAFILDADREGVIVNRPEQKMGLRSSRTAMVALDGVRVPKSALLGKEGQGFSIALATLDHSRLGIAAQALGIARAAMEEALRYARDRRQFGRPLFDHEAIAFRLAEMDTDIAAARALLNEAAQAASRPGRHSRESARAKLFASEMCNRVVASAIQIHGGYGYSKEYAIERLYRDARVTTVYEGTSEVQKIVISRTLKELAQSL
ncbi:MAG: acyl-CoA dehydrogenase [Acidobacteria bacterium]|nr:acyl-CoA dehydrogenase [Acidobacteriota bacterium]